MLGFVPIKLICRFEMYRNGSMTNGKKPTSRSNRYHSIFCGKQIHTTSINLQSIFSERSNFASNYTRNPFRWKSNLVCVLCCKHVEIKYQSFGVHPNNLSNEIVGDTCLCHLLFSLVRDTFSKREACYFEYCF